MMMKEKADTVLIGFVIGLPGGEMMIGDDHQALIGESGEVLIMAMVVVIALVLIAENVPVLIMVVVVAVLPVER